MAPSSILRSSLRLSSTARRTITSGPSVFPTQSRYVGALNASSQRRSIWGFLSGDKPEDPNVKKEEMEKKKNKEHEQVEIQETRPRPEARQQQKQQQQKKDNQQNAQSPTTKVPPSSMKQPIENKIASPSHLKLSWLSKLQIPPIREYQYTIKRGTVTSVGHMSKTVRVAYQHREWDRKIRKYYPKTTTYLVHDPRNSLREGDVIDFSSGAPRAPNVRHVVERIVAPFGSSVEDRPPVPTRAEREEEMLQKKKAKLVRQAERIAEQSAQEGSNVESAVALFVNSMNQKKRVGKIRSLVISRAADYP